MIYENLIELKILFYDFNLIRLNENKQIYMNDKPEK